MEGYAGYESHFCHTVHCDDKPDILYGTNLLNEHFFDELIFTVQYILLTVFLCYIVSCYTIIFGFVLYLYHAPPFDHNVFCLEFG